MSPGGEWEPEAENWLRWARTPDHDAYWYYRDRFLEGLLPPAGRRTLEVGCGEGRVTRDLAERGHSVTAVDSSFGLVGHAHLADRRSRYLVADGALLPFPDGTFNLAVAYNVLMVVADLAATVRDIARVLAPGGRFCACVTHPTADMGRFVDETPDAEFALRGSYFEPRRVDDTVDRDGLRMRFQGWTHPLEEYATSFEEAGLRIEALREPVPTPSGGRYERWHRVPMFLLIKAIKAP